MTGVLGTLESVTVQLKTGLENGPHSKAAEQISLLLAVESFATAVKDGCRKLKRFNKLLQLKNIAERCTYLIDLDKILADDLVQEVELDAKVNDHSSSQLGLIQPNERP